MKFLLESQAPARDDSASTPRICHAGPLSGLFVAGVRFYHGRIEPIAFRGEQG